MTFITGLQSSGVSALLHSVLESSSHGKRLAIVENDCSVTVSADSNIMSEKAYEEVIELSNGCFCCKCRGDFGDALKKLHSKIASFDAVIIEAPGEASVASRVKRSELR